MPENPWKGDFDLTPIDKPWKGNFDLQPATPDYGPNDDSSQVFTGPEDTRSGLRKLFDAHPVVENFFTGTNPEIEEQKRLKGITSVQGPGLMEIPGAQKAADWIKNAGINTGYYYGGVAGDVASQIIGMLGTGFDPRTVGVKSVDPSKLSKALATDTDLSKLKITNPESTIKNTLSPTLTANRVNILDGGKIELKALPKPEELKTQFEDAVKTQDSSAINELQSKLNKKLGIADETGAMYVGKDSAEEKSINLWRGLYGDVKDARILASYASDVYATNNPKILKLGHNGVDNTPSKIKELLKNEKGVLNLRGVTKDKTASIRSSMLESFASNGKINLGDTFEQFKGTVSKTQFNKIVDDILESGDLEKLSAKVKEANRVRDTSPMQMSPENQTPIQQTLSDLMQAVKEHGLARVKQDKLLSAEKKVRIQNAMGVKTPGLSGYFEQLSKLKGEYPKVQAEIKSTIFSPENVDNLINMVDQEPGLSSWDKLGAKEAIGKITGNRPSKGALAQHEIADLQRVFGNKLTDDLVELHGGLGLSGLNPTFQNLTRVGSFAKSLKSSADLGGFFRAGKNYAFQKEWRDSFIPAVKSYFSPETADNIIERLKNDPIIDDAREHGLAITDYHAASPLNREEFFQSLDAEKVPVLGQLVKASNRSQTVMNDLMRSAKWKTYLDKYQKLYDSMSKTTPDEQLLAEQINPNNVIHGEALKRSIADRVNTATGRGSLGRLEKIAPEINALGFSPRFVASRMRSFNRVFNPLEYAKYDKVERGEAIKQLLSMATVSGGFLGVGALLGNKTGLNPLSTTFLKSESGNNKFDPNGGYQQLIVPVARILAGGTVSGSGKASVFGDFGAQDASSLISNFAESKDAPWLNLAMAIMNRREVTRPTNFKSLNPFENTAGRSLAVPMLAQDIYDVLKDDPSLLNLLAIVPLDAVGIGVQTYSPDDDKDLKDQDKEERKLKRTNLQNFADSFSK